MPKLTETFARTVRNPDEGTAKFWDTEVRGFVLFVGKRTKTWYYQRDIAGRTVRKKIGSYPIITATAARQAAQAQALEMSSGSGKAFQQRTPTLAEALQNYLLRPKLRSEVNKENVLAQVEQKLGDWLGLPLDEITRTMVVRRHGEMASIPSTANHTLRHFRAIWNHARRAHDLPESPTAAIEWFEEAPDGRLIEDLRHWRQVVDGLENTIHAAFFRLLLFTGFRKSEARCLRWEHVHPDRIHLPMTKNGRPFNLPITQVHHQILKPLQGLHRHWVFPSPKSADGHLVSPTRLAWSPHSHRRTFATVAVEAGVIEDVVGRLLNHAPVSVTGQRYARPSLDALRPAMDAACSELVKRTRFAAGSSPAGSRPDSPGVA
jgi:integrase